MRHLKSGRQLGRNASHRLAMFRNMTCSLFEHGRIVTTVPKAKELRSFVEKLITISKEGTQHARRRASAKLPNKKACAFMFTELAPRYADRTGGYTRILKLHNRRLGDAGWQAVIELVKAGEVGRRVKKTAPVAPKVEPAAT